MPSPSSSGRPIHAGYFQEGGAMRFAFFTAGADGGRAPWLVAGRDAVPLGARVGLHRRQAACCTPYYVILLRGYRRADHRGLPAGAARAVARRLFVAITLLGEQLSWLGALALPAWWGRVSIAGGPALPRATHDPGRAPGARWHGLRLAHRRLHRCLHYRVDGYAVKVLLMSPILVDYINGQLRAWAVLAPTVLCDLPTAQPVGGAAALCLAGGGGEPRGLRPALFGLCARRPCRMWRPREVSDVVLAALGWRAFAERGRPPGAAGGGGAHRRRGGGAGTGVGVCS